MDDKFQSPYLLGSRIDELLVVAVFGTDGSVHRLVSDDASIECPDLLGIALIMSVLLHVLQM